MKEITLDQPKKEVLKVNIGQKSYSVPLAGSLPFVELKKIRKLSNEEREDFIMEFIQRHIDAKVFNTLDSAQVEQLIRAWSDASREEQGATPGES